MNERFRGPVPSGLGAALVLAAALCWGPFVPASAQSATGATRYQFVLPAGWTRARDADAEVLTPGSEPKGTVQVLILAPKPLAGEFDQQFAAERIALEQLWGLRGPQPVAPQRGQSLQGPYAAFFASYDSDSGPRYMSFLAQANTRQFALVVFVAASHDAFNRVAPQATELFKNLELTP